VQEYFKICQKNTVDLLETVRHLKSLGIDVWFEKESIWTFQARGEILLTILSSLSQEEARSVSENVTWGLRKKFADGKFSVDYFHFLGYVRLRTAISPSMRSRPRSCSSSFGFSLRG